MARSSALIGSPAQIVEKVHRYHERFGHQAMHLHADPDRVRRAVRRGPSRRR